MAERNPYYSSGPGGALYNKEKTVLIRCPAVPDGCYTVPDSVTEIGESAFAELDELTQVRIPASVRIISAEAFQSCYRLKEVEIPSSVEYIGDEAFVLCGLEKVVFSGNAGLELGNEPFLYCWHLNQVIFEGDAPNRIGDHAFGLASEELTVYYREGTVGWTSPTWKGYPSKMQAQKKPFRDVEEGRFYANAVTWAVDAGVTAGKTSERFAPEEACTRAQVVTFLWRACGSPQPSTAVNPFVDVQEGKFYMDAVLWAAENGVTGGLDGSHFAPDQTVTRAQFVTFLYRAKGMPVASGDNPFRDVQAGAYYTDAISWAVKENVTSGVSAVKFAPGAPCTRGQVVTFLYRGYN